ncbi:hypothetical protein VUR80DRAFT_2553 [Thermomyces stellatus]
MPGSRRSLAAPLHLHLHVALHTTSWPCWPSGFAERVHCTWQGKPQIARMLRQLSGLASLHNSRASISPKLSVSRTGAVDGHQKCGGFLHHKTWMAKQPRPGTCLARPYSVTFFTPTSAGPLTGIREQYEHSVARRSGIQRITAVDMCRGPLTKALLQLPDYVPRSGPN